MRESRGEECTVVNKNGSKSMKKETIDNDKLLLLQIAEGNRHALADLYFRFQRPIFSYLLQLTPDYGLAEELLQDTFVAIWKSAQSFEGRSSVPTWIFSIARRQAHNTLRQRRLLIAPAAELDGLVSTDPEPEDLTLAFIARDELVDTFNQLAPVYREVLVLTF